MAEERPHLHDKSEKDAHDHSKEKTHAPEEKAQAKAEEKTEVKAEEKIEEPKVEAKERVAKKKHPKPVAKPKAEGEKLETDEVVEEKKKRVKIKPQLDDRTRKALALKNEMARKRRKFKHQQWNFSKEMDRTGWRKPRGKFSKMRHHQVAQGDIVSIGYRGPRLARGMHPSGFIEVMVHNAKELLKVDAKHQAARIASAVGGRKRTEIEERAEELGIRVLNRRTDPEHSVVRVRSIADLEGITPERHTVFIMSCVSRQGRETIQSAAEEKGFKVLNPVPGKVKK
jgi:large subunit ribosomal protein L32e